MDDAEEHLFRIDPKAPKHLAEANALTPSSCSRINSWNAFPDPTSKTISAPANSREILKPDNDFRSIYQRDPHALRDSLLL